MSDNQRQKQPSPPPPPSFIPDAEKNSNPIWSFQNPDETAELARRNVREVNRKLRAIHIEAGAEYPDEDLPIGPELKLKADKAKDLTITNIKNALQQIKASRVVDLCFLIDGTGSMEKWINDVKMSINAVCDYLLTPRKNHSVITKLRLALIVYRDFSEEDDEQFEMTEFTEDRENFQRMLAEVVAKGGGDGAEDVFGGLQKVAELEWDNAAGSRIVFHLADAPCHGKDFHDDSIIDDYPDGDPVGRNIEDLIEIFNVMRVMYAFGKITSSTDIMIDKFSDALGKPITTFDLTKETMEDIIKRLNEDTVTSMTATAAHALDFRPEKPHKIVKQHPNWNDVPVLVGTLLSYKYPLSLDDVKDQVPFDRQSIADARVKIAPNPFDAGAVRIASYGMSIGASVSTPLVIKEDKYVRAVEPRVAYETYLEMQTVSAYLAKLFHEKLARVGVRPLSSIKFINAKVLTVLNEDESYRYCLCEPLLLAPVSQVLARKASAASLPSAVADKARYKRLSVELTSEDAEALNTAPDDSTSYVPTFVRFSNNVDYCASIDKVKQQLADSGIDESQLDLLFAFSHWTYETSDHWLMVVDLRGVLTVDGTTGRPQLQLTDPAIHCEDTTRFRPTNFGVDGMKSFFSGHECNQFCKALNLPERKVIVPMGDL